MLTFVVGEKKKEVETNLVLSIHQKLDLNG